MKVLMFGWELPPRYAGGIGMVCYDLINELATQNIDVTYVMPFGPPVHEYGTDARANLVIAEHHSPHIHNKITLKSVETLMHVYQSPEEYEKHYEEWKKTSKSQLPISGNKNRKLYGPDLFSEVDLFAKRAWELVDDFQFDVIHAHDWMTFPAAIAAADRSKKPLIVHVHNTIFDRYLGNASDHERDIEIRGMVRADKVVCVSNMIKKTVIEKYGIDPNKVEVVHNSPNSNLRKPIVDDGKEINFGTDKVVLFAGRVTIQKGPEYFIHVAKDVLSIRDDVTFVVAGTGDKLQSMIELANELGVGHKVKFTGFYTLPQARKLFGRADCFIMPSVSEPFGITPLEAMDYKTPAIISRSSGCAEVFGHTLKSDFWDTRRMANQVLALIQYPQLHEELSTNGFTEVTRMNWEKPAKRCIDLYHSVINK